MAIHIVTGIPGHGKTLHMVRTLIETLIPETAVSGREIFHNINEFDAQADHVHPITDGMVYEWYTDDGPKNAIIVLDEAQFLFPVRNPSARVPEYIEKLSIHRHSGLDFYLITQSGDLLDRFIKPLIETHTDVYRPYGMKISRVTKYPYYASQTKHRMTLQMGETTRLKFKPEYFNRYKSASMHTMHPSLPWKKFAMLAGAIGLVIAGAGGAFWAMKPDIPVPTTQMTQDGPVAAPCDPLRLLAVGSRTYPPVSTAWDATRGPITC